MQVTGSTIRDYTLNTVYSFNRVGVAYGKIELQRKEEYIMLKRIFANILILGIAVLCISSVAYADTDSFADNITMVSGDNGFDLNFLVDRSEAVNASDRINIIVLKPNCDFDSLTNESDIENSIFLIKTAFGSESSDSKLFSYSFPSSVGNESDIDIYPVKVAVTAYDGRYSEVNLQYKKVSDDYRANAIKLLSTVGKDGFVNVWTNVAAPMFDISDTEDFDKYINLISAQFVLTRDAYFSENNISEFEDLPSIINCVHQAMSLYAIENTDKNTAEGLVKKYGIVYDDRYDFSKDFSAFYTLYSAVKDDYKDAKNLDHLKKACIMANMQNGASKRTPGEIAECIRKYANELKIDLSYAIQKNVSINQVAARVDADNISNYYKNTSWFTDLVDTLYSEGGQDGGYSPSRVSGGGSGSGRGGSVSIGGTSGNTPDDNVNLPQREEQPQIVFNDLDGYDWAKDAIENLFEKNVVSGDGNGKYSPSRNVTREEFVKMLCLAFDIYSPMKDSDISFEDVTAQDWFYPYVCVAKISGIVNGISDTAFGTGENITRQDMACMLYNLLIYKNVNVVSENNQFSDNGTISPYAEKAVDTLTSLGIIGGFDDNTFRPNENADRGQAAKMIYNMVLYLE